MVLIRELHNILFAVSSERRGQPAIYQAVELSQRQCSALIENSAEAVLLSLDFGVLNCGTILYKPDSNVLLFFICEVELDCWNALFKNLAALLVISVGWEFCMLIDLSFSLDLCYVMLILLELLLKDELAVLSNCVV